VRAWVVRGTGMWGVASRPQEWWIVSAAVRCLFSRSSFVELCIRSSHFQNWIELPHAVLGCRYYDWDKNYCKRETILPLSSLSRRARNAPKPSESRACPFELVEKPRVVNPRATNGDVHRIYSQRARARRAEKTKKLRSLSTAMPLNWRWLDPYDGQRVAVVNNQIVIGGVESEWISAPPVNVMAFLGAGVFLRHLQRRVQREGTKGGRVVYLPHAFFFFPQNRPCPLAVRATCRCARRGATATARRTRVPLCPHCAPEDEDEPPPPSSTFLLPNDAKQLLTNRPPPPPPQLHTPAPADHADVGGPDADEEDEASRRERLDTLAALAVGVFHSHSRGVSVLLRGPHWLSCRLNVFLTTAK
jgi:hypothetical protein